MTNNVLAKDITDALFALLPQLEKLRGWERDKAKEDMRRRVSDLLPDPNDDDC